MKYFILVFKRAFDTSGRSSRKEYWIFTLINSFFATLSIIVDLALETNFKGFGFGYFYLIYALITLVPGITLVIRRLHDVGERGWRIFVSLLPIIGGLWLLYLLLTKGDSENNNYGPAPIETDEEIEQNRKLTQTALITFLIYQSLTVLFFRILSLSDENSEHLRLGWYKYYSVVNSLVWSIFPFILVFLIKNKNWQLAMFYSASLIYIIHIYLIIQNFTKMLTFQF